MKRNRIIALLLTLVMVLSTTVSYAGTTKYTAQYFSSIDESLENVEFNYSDAWFGTKSTKYNNKLAIASMGLNLAAGAKTEDNISKLMTDMGFSKYKSNYASKDEKNDNVCVSYAMKKTGKYTIIPVVVRGSHYTYEWIYNFETGKSGDAKGYSSAAKIVTKYVNNYISDNGISKSKVRLWVVGYSRGAAIADLAAKSLTSKYGKARVYGYCFESPMTNKGNAKKTNIHHVKNKNDGVVCVMPPYMGFGIAGKVNKTIGGGSEAAMKTALKKVVSGDVDKIYTSPKGFSWAKVDTSLTGLLSLTQGVIKTNKTRTGEQQDFWKLVIKRVKKEIPSRKAYTSVYSAKTKSAAEKLGVKAMTIEESFMGIMKWYQTLTDAQKSAVTENIGSAVGELTNVLSLGDLMKLFDSEAGNFKLTDEQYVAVVKAFAKALGGNDEFKAAIAGGLDLAISLVDADLASEQQILGTVLFKDASGSNLDRIICAHRPEINMAWLMAK